MITGVVVPSAAPAQHGVEGRNRGREERIWLESQTSGCVFVLPAWIEREAPRGWGLAVTGAGRTPKPHWLGCFLISTRGASPAIPVPGAVWEGQAKHQGPWVAGSPVLRLALADLGFCPGCGAPVGGKRTEEGDRGQTAGREDQK